MPTLFMKMVRGEIPCHKVYEDEHALAFLDINPLSRGHTLVIPKVPVARLGELKGEELAGYMAALPKVAAAVEAGVEADGLTIAWNDGTAAGQEVPHVHAHIVPRWDGDGHGPIHALFHRGDGSAGGDAATEEAPLEDIADAIRARAP